MRNCHPLAAQFHRFRTFGVESGWRQYDNAALKLFVNGTQVASRTTIGAIQATDSPLWIGGNNPYGEFFQGLIDEVRVYDRGLTQADIQADMNAPIPSS